MSLFGAYSKYYNLLYSDKDYSGEAHYIHELIREYAVNAKNILDLGCGTGRHDFEFAKLGYEVTGVDLSEEMLSVAKSRQSPLTFVSGDIRSVHLNQQFDVVVSLFHVMSYQITNEDLQATLSTVKTHLKPGGLFIFDCWYGPAVLSDPPVIRVKRLEDKEISVIRIAEPVMHCNDNMVDVKYEINVTEKTTGLQEILRETHRMRYLFLPEIDLLLQKNGLKRVFNHEWVTKREAGIDTWGVCIGCVSR